MEGAAGGGAAALPADGAGAADWADCAAALGFVAPSAGCPPAAVVAGAGPWGDCGCPGGDGGGWTTAPVAGSGAGVADITGDTAGDTVAGGASGIGWTGSGSTASVGGMSAGAGAGSVGTAAAGSSGTAAAAAAELTWSTTAWASTTDVCGGSSASARIGRVSASVPHAAATLASRTATEIVFPPKIADVVLRTVEEIPSPA